MKTGVAFSAAAHATLIILGLVGLNFGQPLQPEPVESISVDLVPVEEFSNIRKGTLDSDVIETPTPSITESDKPAELAQPTGNTEQDQPTPERAPTPSPAPTRQSAPEAQPDPEPEPVQESTSVPTPAETPPPPASSPPPTPEPTPDPAPTPDQPPAVENPELAAPTPSAEPAVPVAAPVARTSALDQKRAEFQKQQEAKKVADAKAKADAEAKKVADAEAKKKSDAESKAVADAAAKKAADAKKVADAKKKADEAKKAAQQAAAKQADDISDIINNEPSRGGTTGQGGSPTVGKPTGQAATLSNSQIAALGAQIKGCLNVPAGAAEAGLIVKLEFAVDASGTVVGNPKPVQPAASGLEQTYVSAATRAVLRCGPYSIAAGQDVRVTFDPNEF